MAASSNIPFFLLLSHNPPSPSTYHHPQSKLPDAMFVFLVLFTLSLSVFVFSLHRRLRKAVVTQKPNSATQCSPSESVDSSVEPSNESQLPDLGHSLLVEILPSNSPKWEALFSEEDVGLDQTAAEASKTGDSGGEDGGKKKRKKRAKKKKPDSPNSTAEDCGGGGGGGGEGGRISAKEALRMMKEKQKLVCLYPFTSSSSATQRKIKQQYDQLVKSHESTGLTLTQVAQFVNCLIDAKTELQHKSDVIQRKFTITKALLFKADRSSFDRLRQQIYKLEAEQKRLEEDAFVYNWLQQQLKLSPAYKKMLEVGTCMELKAKVKEQTERADAEFADISFEELLAQEKKDSFWQKNGKPRSIGGC